MYAEPVGVWWVLIVCGVSVWCGCGVWCGDSVC